MREQHISFEAAKLSYKKGYSDSEEPYRYNIKTKELRHRGSSWKVDGYYSAPPQSILQKWLRDTHNIKCAVIWYDDSINKYWASYIGHQYLGGLDIYEEALEKALVKALKQIEL